MNSQKSVGKKINWGTAKAVSNKFRKFHNITADRLQALKTKTMKKRSESKMLWGVCTYQEWREKKLNDVSNYNEDIFNANLDDLKNVTISNLEKSLCIFIAEVTKVNGDDYRGTTLYQLTVSIQKFLNENDINWKLVDGPQFKQLRVVLDNIMKEGALQNIGMVKKQAQLLFLVGINCGLRAGDEHHDLRRDAPGKPSQFSFQRSENGDRCVVYTEDTVTNTNDGGLKHMRKDHKVVWVHPSKDIRKCPVCLIDKYMSLCPDVGAKSKPNFYLRPLDKINPAQWYSTRVVGVNTLRKVVGKLFRSSELDGYFTNHSL